MNGVEISNVAASVFEFTISTGLTAGQSYDFAIQSSSNIGRSEVGHYSKFWAIDVPSKPVLTLIDQQRDSCTFDWLEVSAPTDSVITGYVLLVDDGLGSNEFVIGYDGSNNPSKFEGEIENLEP